MDSVDWELWDGLIAEHGIEIDRPKGSDHPRFPGWTYPVDYGYVPGTVGGDGTEVDVYSGSADTGLTGAIIVEHDGVEELKLLWNMTREETRLAVDFLRGLPSVRLVRR